MGLSDASRLMREGRLAEAELECRNEIRGRPFDAEPCHLLGLILHQRGQDDEAIELLKRATALSPRNVRTRINLAALLGPRQPEEALEHLLHALKIRGDVPEIHGNIAASMERMGRLCEAEGFARTAIRLRYDYPEAHFNLGSILRRQGRVVEARDAYQQALALRPNYGNVHDGLAIVAAEMGDAPRAVECYRTLMELEPENPDPRSALLYTLHYLDDMDAEALAREHLEWGRLFCDPLHPELVTHPNRRDPDRKLRVGYVSPDLREHTPPRFISASFEHHDRASFEVFCYSDAERPDAVTRRLQGFVENWCDTHGLTDEALEHLIREDNIDILVDLRGHAADNRLTLFARKPAPVQVNMVGYFNTTGLSAMDWRVTDAHMDPPGVTERLNRERLMRIEPSCWCYSPADNPPDVADTPAPAKGYVTFGSLNKIVKVSPTCARLWARVLEAVPNSRLTLPVPKDAESSVRERLATLGLPADRLDIPDKTGTTREYLERYHQIDIALDTYPFGGITTTCDALWMGVPCVSLAGGTSVSRAGKSILHAAELGHLAADTPEQFVKIACDLARDIDALRELRRGMRDRLVASPLMDHVGYARKLDAAYRQTWREWCGI